MPPASTTPAFFSTGRRSGVCSSASAAPLQTALPHVDGVVVDLGRRAALLAGQARHGEDGALGGLHDGLVRGLHAHAERVGEIGAGQGGLAGFTLLEKPRKSSERMTPELPRAPRSRAEAAVCAI